MFLMIAQFVYQELYISWWLESCESKSDPNNYRPISVLPIACKIIEKIIFIQLYNSWSKWAWSSRWFHHGFGPMHSTPTAILEARNDWYLSIDNGSLKGVLFFDLKKTFDTINHYILLEKLKLYVVDTPSLSWSLLSYLSNRKQRTCINGFFSNEQSISCTLPFGAFQWFKTKL